MELDQCFSHGIMRYIPAWDKNTKKLMPILVLSGFAPLTFLFTSMTFKGLCYIISTILEMHLTDPV